MRTIVLVHGMGQNTADDFRETFAKSAIESLALYGLTGKWTKSKNEFAVNYDGNKWEKTRVIGFGYNELFESRRQRIGDGSKSVLERLETVGLADNPRRSIVSGLANLGAAFGKDKFFQTHFGDVLMYAFTTVGEQVRISLAEMIAGIIARGTAPTDIHIVAHSLGNSVTHDALAHLSAKHHERGASQLNIVTHKLGSVHMIANVSNVLDYYVPVFESYVRPGKEGCVNAYYQYNNTFDPFTRVSPFAPKNDGSWVISSVYRNSYKAVATNDISGGNVHGLRHYLLNPENSARIFAEVFNVDLTSVFAGAKAAYKLLTLDQKAQAAKQALQKVSITDEKSIKNMEKALKALSKFLKDIKSSWDD